MFNHTVASRYKSIDHLPATTFTARDTKDFGDGEFFPLLLLLLLILTLGQRGLVDGWLICQNRRCCAEIAPLKPFEYLHAWIAGASPIRDRNNNGVEAYLIDHSISLGVLRYAQLPHTRNPRPKTTTRPHR